MGAKQPKNRKYGPNGDYYRKKIKDPAGKYVSIYGRTIAERDEKVREQLAVWAEAERLAGDPFFYEYAAEWYRRESVTMSDTQRTNTAREINKNICPVIGSKRLAEITADDVADVMAARGALSKAAREKTLRVLKHILESARRAKKIPENPAEDIKAGGRVAERKEALTKEQERTLLEAVQGLPVWLFAMICLYTGTRSEEACGLTWDELELDGDVPAVNIRQVARWPDRNQPQVSRILKSDAAYRTIPLSGPIVKALREERSRLLRIMPEAQLRARPVLANKKGGHWSYQTLAKAWRAVTVRSTGTATRKRKDPLTGQTVEVEVEKRLGDVVPNHPGVVVSIDFPVTPHILRYTFITRCILGGLDIKRTQYLAGHATPALTLQIYTTLMEHRPEDIAPFISKIFDGE